MSDQETLGLMLVRAGVIARPQLYDALRLQRQNNRLLGTCLLDLGYVTPNALLEALSRQLGVPALPLGRLREAQRAAVDLVPRQLALELRIVPYSFDGRVLAVALADGRALAHLARLADHTGKMVGAYVALEREIDATLSILYPDVVEPAQVVDDIDSPAFELSGRPRPPKIEVHEVPSVGFGEALGFEAEAPIVLDKKKAGKGTAAEPSRAAAPAAPPPVRPAPPPLAGAPPAAPARPAAGGPPPIAPSVARVAPPTAGLPSFAAPPAAAPQAPVRTPTAPVPAALSASTPATMASPALPGTGFDLEPATRANLYDAIEHIYDAAVRTEIATWVCAALLNYFSRVIAFTRVGGDLVALCGAAFLPLRGRASLGATLKNSFAAPQMRYGPSADDERVVEIALGFGFHPGKVALMAPVVGERTTFVFLADNGDAPEVYEDLHDIELLLKEAQTALGMLGG